MLFNSIDFALFLPIVFLLYWFLFKKNLKCQNILLLVASYFFYACWDWRFLFLLVFSTILDYSTGILMSEARTQRLKKFWFWLSIVANIGFLGFFKYYNFFVESFADGLGLLGVQVNPMTLNIILPVGISFYTFHGLSYVIDIYQGRIKPEKNFIDYSLFVSFFPLLVAGPIERATHLLPQLKKERSFDYSKSVDGLRQILWGLFKKMVIADGCAIYVNDIFANYDQMNGSSLLIGAILFTFQIYGDFSGYSDIALGTARLFGVELLQNFAFPYFSRDIAEFWRRWHISLSSWFKDYIYIPLGGSRVSLGKRIRNTFIIFLISGLWHGANWTFIVYGFLHAVFFLPLLLFKRNRSNLEIVAKGRMLPSFNELTAMLMTFALTVLSRIFFRSESLTQAFGYFDRLFSFSFFSIPDFKANNRTLSLFVLIFLFMLIEWKGRESKYGIERFALSSPRVIRLSFYAIVLCLICAFQAVEDIPFIYFHF